MLFLASKFSIFAGMKECFFTSHDAEDDESIKKESNEKFVLDNVIGCVSIIIAPIIFVALKALYSLLR
jgi:hypothetical protein